MPEIQAKFSDEGTFTHRKQTLTENQRKIISLISCGLTQAQTAKRLGFSRPYVNQVIKKLESSSLIKRIKTQVREGVRAYNYFYEVAPEAKTPGTYFTPFRVHAIRKKFRILKQSGEISTDKRTSFNRSWKIRGPLRHKFWYPGKAGYPAITLEIHPKTIVAYMDKGQQVAAESMEKAKELAWLAIYRARDQFIEEQALFGITIETETAGEEIGKPHAGLVMHEGGPFRKEDPKLPGLWVDNSVEKELGPGFFELEGHIDNKALTAAEQGLIAASDIRDNLPGMIRAAMPDAIRQLNEKLDPLQENVLRVEAMLQGGITIQQQYNQMVNFMTKALDEMAAIRKENAELKTALNLKQ